MARIRRCPRLFSRNEADIQISALRVSPFHPRGEQFRLDRQVLERIMCSIEQVGFFGSISVTPGPDRTYLIEDGVARVCACHLLGRTEIPTIISTYDPRDRVTAMMLGLTVNVCRHPLDLAELARLAWLRQEKALPLTAEYVSLETATVQICLDEGQRATPEIMREVRALAYYQERDSVAEGMDTRALAYADLELAKYHSGVSSAVDSILPKNPELSSLPDDELRAAVLPDLVAGKTGVPASVIFNVDDVEERLHRFGTRTGNYEHYVRAHFKIYSADTPPIDAAGREDPRPAVYIGREGPLDWDRDAATLLKIGRDPTREVYEAEPPNKVRAAMSLCEALNYPVPQMLLDTIARRGAFPEPAAVGAELEDFDEPRPLAALEPTTVPPQPSDQSPGQILTLLRQARTVLATHASSTVARLIVNSGAAVLQGASDTLHLGHGAAAGDVRALLRTYRHMLVASKGNLLRLELLNYSIFGGESVSHRILHRLALHPDRYRELTPLYHDAAERDYFSNPTPALVLSQDAGTASVPLLLPAPDSLPSSVAIERLPAAIAHAS